MRSEVKNLSKDDKSKSISKSRAYGPNVVVLLSIKLAHNAEEGLRLKGNKLDTEILILIKDCIFSPFKFLTNYILILLRLTRRKRVQIK